MNVADCIAVGFVLPTVGAKLWRNNGARIVEECERRGRRVDYGATLLFVFEDDSAIAFVPGEPQEWFWFTMHRVEPQEQGNVDYDLHDWAGMAYWEPTPTLLDAARTQKLPPSAAGLKLQEERP